jgi:hypothetical protein
LFAAVIAAWFAYPAYRDLRERPDLVLTVTVVNSSTANGQDGDVGLRLSLTNHGPGKAKDWRVAIASVGNLVKLSPIRPSNPGDAIEQATADGWRIDWQARDAADAIGRNHTRPLFCKTTRFALTAWTVGSFSITAERMDQRDGRFRVGWGEDAQPLIDNS